MAPSQDHYHSSHLARESGEVSQPFVRRPNTLRMKGLSQQHPRDLLGNPFEPRPL